MGAGPLERLAEGAETREAGERRAFLPVVALALAVGLIYCAVTPPGRVPDEIGHFLRAVAIADGDPFPPPGPTARGHHFPLGFRMFLYRIGKESDPEARFSLSDVRSAYAEPLQRETKSGLEFPAWYTPAPYAVTTALAFAGLRAGVRPIWIFYAGRVANLVAGIAIIALAMRLLPRRAGVFAAVLLLPMTMYELASWSADAMTIAVAVLLISLMARNLAAEGRASPGELLALCGVALAAGLCKPAYFLLVAPVAFIPTARFGSRARRVLAVTLIAGSMALGTLGSVAAARAGHYLPRRGLPVDPQQQMQCIRKDPVRFATIALRDMGRHAIFYMEQAVGRLGWMNVKLPRPLVAAQWMLLVWVALTCGAGWNAGTRLVAIVACAAMIAGISLSQYLVWSIICGDSIEGIQGRYYLPFLPLLMLAASVPRWETRRPSLAFIGAAGIIVNAVAIAVLVQTYWS